MFSGLENDDLSAVLSLPAGRTGAPEGPDLGLLVLLYLALHAALHLFGGSS